MGERFSSVKFEERKILKKLSKICGGNSDKMVSIVARGSDSDNRLRKAGITPGKISSGSVRRSSSGSKTYSDAAGEVYKTEEKVTIDGERGTRTTVYNKPSLGSAPGTGTSGNTFLDPSTGRELTPFESFAVQTASGGQTTATGEEIYITTSSRVEQNKRAIPYKYTERGGIISAAQKDKSDAARIRTAIDKLEQRSTRGIGNVPLQNAAAFGLGGVAFVVETADAIAHPIKTAKGIFSAVTHPRKTGEAIRNEFSLRPYGFTGRVAAAITTGRIVGKLVGKTKGAIQSEKAKITTGTKSTISVTDIGKGKTVDVSQSTTAVQVGKKPFIVQASTKGVNKPDIGGSLLRSQNSDFLISKLGKNAKITTTYKGVGKGAGTYTRTQTGSKGVLDQTIRIDTSASRSSLQAYKTASETAKIGKDTQATISLTKAGSPQKVQPGAPLTYQSKITYKPSSAEVGITKKIATVTAKPSAKISPDFELVLNKDVTTSVYDYTGLGVGGKLGIKEFNALVGTAGKGKIYPAALSQTQAGSGGSTVTLQQQSAVLTTAGTDQISKGIVQAIVKQEAATKGSIIGTSSGPVAVSVDKPSNTVTTTATPRTSSTTQKVYTTNKISAILKPTTKQDEIVISAVTPAISSVSTTDEITSPITGTRAITRSKVKQDQIVSQVTAPAFDTISETNQKIVPKVIQSQARPPVSPPPAFFPSFFSAPPVEKENLSQGYNVEARFGGVFKQISRSPLSLKDAVGFGSVTVGSTPQASFRVSRSSQPASGVFKGRSQIQDFERRPGGLFVEKDEKRINTLGELQGITRKGQLAIQQRRFYRL